MPSRSRHSNARVLTVVRAACAACRTPSSSARATARWYFLETSARVGGAFIVDVVEAATGLNLWREWARIEIAGEDGTYEPPPRRDRCGGIVLSLARQEAPDMSAYTDPEIVVRVRKSHHAGLIVASPDGNRVVDAARGYTERFYVDFHASAPPPERPTD